MPKGTPDTGSYSFRFSDIVRAAAVAIGAEAYSVDRKSLQRLSDEVEDDELLTIFRLSLAEKEEFENQGTTGKYYKLLQEKDIIESGVRGRLTADYTDPEKDFQKRFEVYREISALTHGLYALTETLVSSR